MRVVYKERISGKIFAAREEAKENLREIDRIVLTQSEAGSLRREVLARGDRLYVPQCVTGMEYLGVCIEVEDD